MDGGAARIQPSVLLSAGNGEITGTVTDGSAPLGGTTVSTTVAGTAVTTGTPTTGDVGQFVLGDLPTPATYVLTVSGPGYGETTVVVDLGPGELRTDLAVSLASGTGMLTGQLVDASGAGIGGAMVTVGGMTNPPTTSTLTDGTVGAFTVSGLPAGGALTLTFTHAGFAETTVPVQPGTTPVTVTMSASQGQITGQITGERRADRRRNRHRDRRATQLAGDLDRGVAGHVQPAAMSSRSCRPAPTPCRRPATVTGRDRAGHGDRRRDCDRRLRAAGDG